VNLTALVVKEWRAVLKKCNAPEDLIQSVENASIERTAELMRNVDVIVATGGPGMVKAAYSSGKPSYGVGPGNIQCIVDRGVDLKDAAKKIVYSRVFDYGIICSGDQGLIVPTELYEDFLKELEGQKAFVVKNPNDKEKLTSLLFPEGKTNTKLVGQPATKIASLAGIEVPPDTVMLAVPVSKEDTQTPLRREKMFPVAIVLTYDEFSQALEIMKFNLNLEGKGHSVCIHVNNKEHVEMLGLWAPASSVIVNAPSTVSTGGNFYNGLAPTSTLGCGSWGNNSISENFTYKHLLNITRIAYPLTNPKIPTDQELFGDEV
jgi:succinate-semialdehyde dehydrogenase